MISYKYNCIFVEVPKTASSSIRRIIGHAPKAHLNICQIRHEMETNWTNHEGISNKIMSCLSPYLSIRWKIKRGQEQFQQMFKFGFVRNPWDRMVSLYERQQGLQLKHKMSFEEFIDWAKYSSSTCIHPLPHRYQLDWFVDPSGELLVDFIGRFENLDKDWSIIRKKLGISEALPHVNGNIRKKHYTEYYTNETRRIVAKRFAEDIEYFDYSFD